MRRKKWIRVLAVAGTVALAASLALPAIGKGKPSKDEVVVTMSYVGAGIATSELCSSGALVMNQERSGLMRADWTGANDVEMALTTDAVKLTDCHGGLVAGTGEEFAGYFILDPTRDGGVKLTSRFDYYWEYEKVTNKSGKTRTVQTGLELFEINADLRGDEDFDWSASGEPQTVTGQLELLSFEKNVGWTPLGTTDITMTITINAAP